MTKIYNNMKIMLTDMKMDNFTVTQDDNRQLLWDFFQKNLNKTNKVIVDIDWKKAPTCSYINNNRQCHRQCGIDEGIVKYVENRTSKENIGFLDRCATVKHATESMEEARRGNNNVGKKPIEKIHDELESLVKSLNEIAVSLEKHDPDLGRDISQQAQEIRTAIKRKKQPESEPNENMEEGNKNPENPEKKPDNPENPEKKEKKEK